MRVFSLNKDWFKINVKQIQDLLYHGFINFYELYIIDNAIDKH